MRGVAKVRALRCAYNVLLSASPEINLPIMVADVAAPYDVRIVRADLGPDMDATFIPTGAKGGIIVVNNRNCRTRRRFSSAHELGHYLLDTPAERPANIFAASLLMPSIPFISIWRRLVACSSCIEECVAATATTFWVSRTAAAVRARELNLN